MSKPEKITPMMQQPVALAGKINKLINGKNIK